MSQTVEDIIAIQQLAARYNHAFDSRDAEGWVATFVEGGSFQAAGRDPVVGPEALAAFVLRTDGTTKHFNSNLLIEVDGDAAEMTVYLDLKRREKTITTGVYRDTLRRVDGRWLFVTRLFTADPREAASAS